MSLTTNFLLSWWLFQDLWLLCLDWLFNIVIIFTVLRWLFNFVCLLVVFLNTKLISMVSISGSLSLVSAAVRVTLLIIWIPTVSSVNSVSSSISSSIFTSIRASFLLFFHIFNASILSEIVFVVEISYNSLTILIAFISSNFWWFTWIFKLLMSFKFLRFSSMSFPRFTVQISELELMTSLVNSILCVLGIFNWRLHFTNFFINLL